MKNDNILTGYCFLAALTENQHDLFNHVFVPICKRALSLYCLKGSTHGTASDIKDLIKLEYGIDIPVIMVKKLINASFKSFSSRSRNKHNFNVIQNGESFQIEKYSFSDLEIHYKKGIRNSNAIELSFQEYIKSEGIEKESVPTFAEFLNKNKKHLACFFKNTAILNGNGIDKTYIHHVHFLEYIETNSHDLFEIAKSLYIGSIVASFLESGIDLEPKFDSNIEYYIDTPVILKALDLQKEEETQPIIELLDLIRKTGGQIKVLSITIDEVHGVLENAINNYNNVTPTTTINEACLRLGNNKAWLIVYNTKLEENILNILKATKVHVSNAFQEKHQKFPDVKALEDERVRKKNALHDVLSYLFVREERGGSVTSFQKAKKWFLTSNIELLKFNRNHNPGNGVSEIVLPDALTSLLWLKDPIKLLSRVKTIGLTELMATTLNDEIASKELINEFESNISKLDGVSEEDYKILLESVAHQSAKKIEHFNELVETKKEEAKVEAHKIVEWERTRKARTQKAVKDAQAQKKEEEDKNKLLIESLQRIELELKDVKGEAIDSKTQLELLAEKLQAQTLLIKKFGWRITIGIICLILSVLALVFYDKLNDVFKIFGILANSGWLWGLGSFAINYYKLKTGK